MIQQLEEMTLTEKIRATTLLAWRWPSAWKVVREAMRAQELKVKKEARKAAEKAVLKAKAVARGNAKVGVVRRPRAKAKSIVAPMAVLKPKAVAKGNTKVARTLRRFPEGDRKDCDELILSPAEEKLKETLKRMCRPAPVVMAVSLPDPLPPRVSAVPGAHKGKVCINTVVLRKYGFTEGCPGCDWVQESIEWNLHSEQCRNRIAEAINKRDRDDTVRVVEESDRSRQKMREVIKNDEEGVRSDVLPFANI
jgi:hypothetical protein